MLDHALKTVKIRNKRTTKHMQDKIKNSLHYLLYFVILKFYVNINIVNIKYDVVLIIMIRTVQKLNVS